MSQEQVGGTMGAALDAFVQALGTVGALGYSAGRDGLTLVADHGLPQKARPWLRHLALGEQDPWFSAQRVARRQRSEVDTELAKQRAGVSIAPVLREAGWGAVAAVPMALGRHLYGVLVLAAAGAEAFDRETLRSIEAACGIVALALRGDSDEGRAAPELEHDTTTQLAAVGLLASSVADDLAGPLRTLQLELEYQESLVRGLRVHGDSRELDELGELTFELAAGVRRIHDIVKRLESSIDASAAGALDLARVARNSVGLMRHHLDSQGIELQVEGDDAELPIDGREPELRMLVVQLLMQAVAQCLRADAHPPRIAISVGSEDDRVFLAIDANGRPPVSRRSGAEIFDALFARGQRAQVDRLGINLAKRTVLAHNGHIEVGPSALGGTQVRVVFPRSAGSVHPEDRESLPMPTLRPMKSNNPVIVWIDDDEVLARSMERFLSSYEVRTAATMAQGRARLADLTAPPAAVFCAVELSDGPGSELHRDVASSLGERFVFVSSGVIPAEVASYLLQSGRPTLIKPIHVDEILAILERYNDSGARLVATTLRPSAPRAVGDSPVLYDSALPDMYDSTIPAGSDRGRSDPPPT
jgi:signal transduction histidine kinase/ActR/RegA family two-component response regulator